MSPPHIGGNQSRKSPVICYHAKFGRCIRRLKFRYAHSGGSRIWKFHTEIPSSYAPLGTIVSNRGPGAEPLVGDYGAKPPKTGVWSVAPKS